MDQAVGLIMLCGVMLIGSFLAGSIPLIMHLSEDKVHFVSVVGAGLLVGTALAVIIPEGIHTLYIASQHEKAFSSSSHPLPLNAAHPSIGQFHEEPKHGHVIQPPGQAAGSPADPSIPSAHDLGHKHGQEMEAFSSIGIALVLGFIFMLLVDQCSRSSSQPSRDLESSSSGHPSKRSFTATLGLVVHAAADGIALGAAATTSHSDVEMIVFFAIMLHKAPAAFGLVTFLLHAGLDIRRVRKHLAIFSFAAPVLAIITYFGISPEGKENNSTMHATAMAMLFSAGTFLYVATVHVLPEVTNSQQGFNRKELLALVVGAILPLLLTAGHHH